MASAVDTHTYTTIHVEKVVDEADWKKAVEEVINKDLREPFGSNFARMAWNDYWFSRNNEPNNRKNLLNDSKVISVALGKRAKPGPKSLRYALLKMGRSMWKNYLSCDARSKLCSVVYGEQMTVPKELFDQHADSLSCIGQFYRRNKKKVLRFMMCCEASGGSDPHHQNGRDDGAVQQDPNGQSQFQHPYLFKLDAVKGEKVRKQLLKNGSKRTKALGTHANGIRNFPLIYVKDKRELSDIPQGEVVDPDDQRFVEFLEEQVKVPSDSTSTAATLFLGHLPSPIEIKKLTLPKKPSKGDKSRFIEEVEKALAQVKREGVEQTKGTGTRASITTYGMAMTFAILSPDETNLECFKQLFATLSKWLSSNVELAGAVPTIDFFILGNNTQSTKAILNEFLTKQFGTKIKKKGLMRRALNGMKKLFQKKKTDK